MIIKFYHAIDGNLKFESVIVLGEGIIEVTKLTEIDRLHNMNWDYLQFTIKKNNNSLIQLILLNIHYQFNGIILKKIHIKMEVIGEA